MTPLRSRPTLELDELWSFVNNKGQKVWIWIALERETRRIVGLAFGNRSSETCVELWNSLPADYRKKAVLYSDFWSAYVEVLPKKRHFAVGKESGETAHTAFPVTPRRKNLSSGAEQFVLLEISHLIIPRNTIWS